MRQVPVRSRAAISAIALAAITAACGGGGGGSGGGGGGGGGGGFPTGSAAGRAILRPETGLVVEAEPNNSVDQPHPLGEVFAGSTLTIIGNVNAATDDFDGFALRCPQRVRITATITYAAGAAGVELALYSPVGMQFLETFPISTSPGSASFDTKGSFDLVVRATSGATDYTLLVAATPVPHPVPERETNDTFLDGHFLGEVIPGDAFQVTGNLTTVDPDHFVLSCPAAARVSFSLDSPAFQDFDLHVFDATADLGSPTPLASFSTLADPETGFVDVAAGTLLAVRATAVVGFGTYTLTITGVNPPAPVMAARLAVAKAVAALSSETRNARGPLPVRPYGRARTSYVASEGLVQLTPGDEEAGRALIAARGGRIAEELSAGVLRVEFAAPTGLTDEEHARFTVARVRGLEATGVVYSEPNHVWRLHSTFPNDALYGLQWHYDQIHLPEAWDIADGTGVIVAVIDTGKTNHPDMVGKWAGGYDFVSNASFAGDGDGRDPDPTEPAWSINGFHGTHVAGTIAAATNNTTGVAGAGWAAKVMPLRVFGDFGESTAADLGEAIRYAARLSNASGALPPTKAHIINMSLGGPFTSTTDANAIAAAQAAGVLVIASAGNEGDSVPQYPASYTGVLSVGATDFAKAKTGYSSFGSTLDIMAPGGDTQVDRDGDGHEDGVLSTLFDGNAFTYDYYQGTSMSAPHAAGVAALVWSVDPTLTANQVQTILIETAQDLGATGRDNTFGWGLVNAYAAVVRAQGETAPVPPPPPPPKLALAANSLVFLNLVNAGVVPIDNIGGGLLTLGTLDVTTSSGGAWLSAVLGGSPSASKTAERVDVAVDRSGLPPGSYAGQIVVHSDGGDATIQVAMAVSLPPIPPPDIAIHVQAVRADTGQIVQTQLINPAAGLTWSFPTLPTGEYYFFASSDIDADGTFFEDGDIVGKYPTTSEPESVQVIQGIPVTGLDFQISRNRSLLPSGQ